MNSRHVFRLLRECYWKKINICIAHCYENPVAEENKLTHNLEEISTNLSNYSLDTWTLTGQKVTVWKNTNCGVITDPLLYNFHFVPCKWYDDAWRGSRSPPCPSRCLSIMESRLQIILVPLWQSTSRRHLLFLSCTFGSPVAQLVKNPPAMQETWVQPLGWEDPREKGKATHSSILAWRMPRTVQSMGSQKVRHDWATFTSFLPLVIEKINRYLTEVTLKAHSEFSLNV